MAQIILSIVARLTARTLICSQVHGSSLTMGLERPVTPVMWAALACLVSHGGEQLKLP
jgi:hypothetical protein